MLVKFKVIIFTLVLSISFCAAFVNDASSDDATDLYIVAQKAFEDGFYDVALNYIEQLHEQYPDSDKRVETQLLLGQCYFFKNQFLKAFETFKDLLQENKYKDATLYWLGETYLKGTDYLQAEEQYTTLINNFPESPYTPQAYYSLGWGKYERGLFDEAKEYFSTLENKFPKHQLVEESLFKSGECDFNLKKYEETITHFEKFIKRHPNSNRHAESFFYIAESHYYLQQYVTAASYYAKVSDLSYQNKLILMSKVSMGWSYLKMNKIDLAKQYFLESLSYAKEKDILSDDVYFGLANLYKDTEEFDLAIEAYSKLITNFPNSSRLAEAYLGKANLFYLLKDYSKSRDAYQNIIDNFSQNIQFAEITEKAYFGLAWSFLKEGNVDASIEQFRKVKDKTENKIVKVSALTQIGDAYQDIGEFQKAIDVYDQILKNYQDSLYTDYIQYRQAVALLKMEDIESATISFQTLKSNFPNSIYNKDASYYLAVAYLKREDWKNTKVKIKNFIDDIEKDNPFYAESSYIYALANFKLNEIKTAQKQFQTIIKNYPKKSELVEKSKLYIAKCERQLGNDEKALLLVQQILIEHPQSQIAQESIIWLGDYYFLKKDYEQSITYYLKFIETFPGSNKINLVYFDLAQSYQANNEYDHAISSYKQIAKSANPDLYSKAQLAIAEIFSKEMNPDEAISLYQDMIIKTPEYARDAYIKIANVYKGAKNYEKTKEYYQKGLDIKQQSSRTEDIEILYMIADTHELENKNDKAIEEHFKLIYLYPKNKTWLVKSYLRIARIFEDREDWDRALKVYHKIKELNTDEMKFAVERIDWINQSTTVNQ